MTAGRKHGPLGYARRITREVAHHPSNRGHVGRALVRSVYWQAQKRLRPRPVDIDYFGLSLRCYPDSQSASNVWYFTERYDYHEMDFVRRFLRPGDGVLDVGANIGTYSLLAATLVGESGWIEAFEADPVNAGRLRENLGRNQLTGVVEVHEAAVCATSGSVEFSVDLDVTNSIRGEHHQTVRTRTIPAVRLDDLVDRPTALAKVDVEGAEVEVLRGAVHLLREGRPAVWLIEVLDHQLRKFDTCREELVRTMVSADHEPLRWDADRAALRPLDDEPRGNCLFVAREQRDEVEHRLRGRASAS